MRRQVRRAAPNACHPMTHSSGNSVPWCGCVLGRRFYTVGDRQHNAVIVGILGSFEFRMGDAVPAETAGRARDGREPQPISPPVAIVAGGTSSTMLSTARRGWITHFHPLRFQKRHYCRPGAGRDPSCRSRFRGVFE